MKKSTLALIPALLTPFLSANAQSTQSDSVTRLPETVSSTGSKYSESALIGKTARPEWTSARRFTGTRVYIQQEPWEAAVESWWRVKHNRDGSVSHRLLEEVEIGLPYRMQLDLYTSIGGNGDGRFQYESFNVELRWALADWGVLWGNPTLYGEYKFGDPQRVPDTYEFKLLLGDEIAKRWHWGVNFVWEAQTGGDREHEFQITGGLSYTLIDKRLGVGVECVYNNSTAAGGRGDASNAFNIGPSVQWRVNDRIHVDATCMFGTNQDSTRQTGFIVVGWSFGKGSSDGGSYTPISGRLNQ